MATVALVGTLDTKSSEYRFVAERLRDLGVEVIMIDCGVLGEPGFPPQIDRHHVARNAGEDLDQLVAAGDRGAAVQAMSRGAARVIEELYAAGKLQGAMALGGTGGTSLAAAAFRPLPLGVPKLIVSTAAAGDNAPYVGETDLILVPSVVDVAGLNRISTRILGNAAAAMAGMVTAEPVQPSSDEKPLVAASMFGVTTPCVTRAREQLEALGYEVLVFHMTGAGGRTLEALVSNGMLAGVLDVTTTELADHLVGGIFDAGPDRLRAAARTGTPAVISLGALDMVNFGPVDSVPERFADRLTYQHNATTTLMRTTPAECRELGTQLAERVRESVGPATVFLPLNGISAIAGKDGAFYDAEADQELFDAVRAGLRDSPVELVELNYDVNAVEFADAMVQRLHSAISGAGSSARQ
ncbi:Tm-1-like ATP-binding domain-containing protein [Kribbella sp. NPDC051952]|uniref:Tm-1-like ATP-binding domain-containing protein n=1 Tax=Kribbella sp. NPDC051952 TaxID=3154851 RepID=UPI0034315B90